MGGIAGLLRFDKKPVTKSDIERMLAAVSHRGRSTVIWTENSVGLGQFSANPLLTAEERIVVQDSLIYNQGNSPESTGGDFAIASWDRKAHALTLCRDPFAVKPLFYVQHPRFFAFASEIKALLALDEVSLGVNEEKIRGFLANKQTDPAETFYRHIRRLLPAHEMTIGQNGKTASRRYWSADPKKETRLSSEDDYAAAFLEYFKVAVKRRIPAAGVVGTTLSGGLDSSSVCAITQQILKAENDPRKLHAFSLMFPDKEKMAYEEPFIQEMLKQYDVEHHRISTEGLSPFAAWREMMKIEEQPLFQITFFLLIQIYRSCKSAGITTLLDGMDGDMTAWHAGNYWFDLFRSGRFVRLYREMRGTRGLHWDSPKSWKKIYGQTLQKSFRKNITRYADERARHAAAFNDFRLMESMETIDRLSAHFGIETRHPFFDKDLVEFCISLPPEQKSRYSFGRWTMRQAMRGILPEMVRMRAGKAEPHTFINEGLHRNDLGAIENGLQKHSHLLAKYTNINAPQDLLSRWKKNPGQLLGAKLWNPASTALWLGTLEKNV